MIDFGSKGGLGFRKQIAVPLQQVRRSNAKLWVQAQSFHKGGIRQVRFLDHLTLVQCVLGSQMLQFQEQSCIGLQDSGDLSC
jgi:hypothetical protein